jgi:hypothetical protein
MTRYKKPNALPHGQLEALGEILKQDVFNLDGLVGLMAVRQAVQRWLTQQPNGNQVTVLAVKPGPTGCSIKLGVTHSTLMQAWQAQLLPLKHHLNSLSVQTHWPVGSIRLVMV